MVRKKLKSKVHHKNQLLFLLHCCQNKPLQLWDKRIRAGHIHQILDQDLHCAVLEIWGWKSSQTYITCPADPRKVLAIRAPFLNMTVKNLQRTFVLDVLVRDSNGVKRRFKALTKQKEMQLKPFLCKIPLRLESGWNQIVVPLHEYTEKAYRTKYVETLRVQMHANCRVQRVFFSYTDEDEGFGRACGLRLNAYQ